LYIIYKKYVLTIFNNKFYEQFTVKAGSASILIGIVGLAGSLLLGVAHAD
jgi:hypothetical protein